jgi:hypothetical protein
MIRARKIMIKVKFSYVPSITNEEFDRLTTFSEIHILTVNQARKTIPNPHLNLRSTRITALLLWWRSRVVAETAIKSSSVMLMHKRGLVLLRSECVWSGGEGARVRGVLSLHL